MENKTKKLSYLAHVDAVRAFAVLLVVLFHLEVNLFSGGFLGVDVFFVISGFLITRLLAHEFTETGTISFKHFYARRARRLLPTLFLTIFLTFTLAFLAFSPSDFMNATNSMLMSAFAISNFYFLGESNYFDIFSNFKPLLHTWSLGVEEQFYLIFPVTLFLLLKLFYKKKNGILMTFIILSLLSFIYTIYASKSEVLSSFTNLFNREDGNALETSSLQFYLLPFRMFEFLFGGIIALVKVPTIKSEYLKTVLHLLGLMLIVTCGILLSKSTPNLSTLNIIPCIGVGLLLFAPPAKFLFFIYENKFLRYTGKISYTLYLIHWLVIVAYRYVFDVDFSILAKIIMFITMFLLSAVIYEFYEKPLRYTKTRFSIKSNRTLVLVFMAGAMSIYFIKLKVNVEDGWLWRLSDENLALIEKIGVPKDYHLNNWGGAGYSKGWVGEIPEDEIIPDMIWIGDSHATHFKYGLDSILVKNNHKHIYIPFLTSILSLPDIIYTARGEKETKKLTDGYFALLKKYPTSLVVISQSWEGQIKASEYFNETTSQYEKIPQDSLGWKIMAQKVEKLQQITGGDDRLFVVLGETPRLNTNKLNFIEKLSRPKYLSSIASPAISTLPNNKIAFNNYFKSYFESIPNIRFIDPSEAICHDGVCLIQKNNEIYFSDSNHLTKDGALKIVSYFEQMFLNLLNENEALVRKN